MSDAESSKLPSDEESDTEMNDDRDIESDGGGRASEDEDDNEATDVSVNTKVGWIPRKKFRKLKRDHDRVKATLVAKCNDVNKLQQQVEFLMNQHEEATKGKFVAPKRTAKGVPIATKPVTVAVSNKFTRLGEERMEDEDAGRASCSSNNSVVATTKKKLNNGTQVAARKTVQVPTTTDAESETEANQTVPKKKLHSPDFHVSDLSVPKFEKEMQARNVQFTAKVLPNGSQRVRCNYEDRQQVREYMETNNVHGTTSTCNHERVGAAVVKGIHIDFEPEEVLNYLESHVDFKIAKVRRFQEKKDGVRPFHWWVVTTDTREQVLQLKNIRLFNNRYPISWEPYVSKRCPRCFRCQAYKHLARNCFKKWRCSKCKDNHEGNPCPLPDPTPDMSPSRMKKYFCHPCADAKQDNKGVGHWAGWALCPVKLALDDEYKTAHDQRTGKSKNDSSALRTMSPRAMQQIPTQEDFNINTRKGLRGVPAPIMITQTEKPNWGPAPAPANRESAYQQQTGVSARNIGGAWADINRDTFDLFGMDADAMIDQVTSFVEYKNTLKTAAEMKKAYLGFYLKMAQCG